jgi:acetylglutamate/LysW-gamma-L-alpha-aminoadipate kinase
MAVNGKLNSLWVEAFQKVGVNALGLCGLDGRLIEAVRKDTIRGIVNGKQIIIRDDYTGKITHVNSRLLDMLQDEGYTPVIAPLAVSPSGEVLNVDADRAAAAVAVSLSVETLVLLTAVPGLMRRFPDESTLIPSLSRAQLEQAFEFAEGRMKKKVLGASEALTGGVFRVIIADGRIDRPISSALDGKGTVIS